MGDSFVEQVLLSPFRQRRFRYLFFVGAKIGKARSGAVSVPGPGKITRVERRSRSRPRLRVPGSALSLAVRGLQEEQDGNQSSE